MGLINRQYTFATMPGISPDIGAKIDTELNAVFNAVNGNLDDANIDGSPAIQSSKLSLGGAGFLPLSGGNMSSTITHAFEGLWRAMGSSGLVREYRSMTGGNILWGISYNTYHNGTSWQGRDISDICLRVELTKTSDGWGGLRVYTADSAGGGVSPTWNPPQHYEPMGGHSRYHNGTAWISIGDITATTETGKSGIFNYNTLNIPSGVTWTLAQGKPLIIFARESVTINGTINGDGMGAIGGTSSAGDNGLAGGSGGGGSSSGATYVSGYSGGNTYNLSFSSLGGNSSIGSNGGAGNIAPLSQLATLPYGELYKLGGGGGGGGGITTSGGGGNGGGFIYIISPQITIGSSGIIKCNGNIGLNGGATKGGGGGGGGGGVIWLKTQSFITSGTLTVNGNTGGTSYTGGFTGGNGGAGVIYIEEYR